MIKKTQSDLSKWRLVTFPKFGNISDIHTCMKLLPLSPYLFPSQSTMIETKTQKGENSIFSSNLKAPYFIIWNCILINNSYCLCCFCFFLWGIFLEFFSHTDFFCTMLFLQFRMTGMTFILWQLREKMTDDLFIYLNC